MDALRATFDEEARWLVVERGPVTIACNLADRARRLGVAGPRHLLLASDPRIRLDAGCVELPRDSVAIFGPPGLT